MSPVMDFVLQHTASISETGRHALYLLYQYNGCKLNVQDIQKALAHYYKVDLHQNTPVQISDIAQALEALKQPVFQGVVTVAEKGTWQDATLQVTFSAVAYDPVALVPESNPWVQAALQAMDTSKFGLQVDPLVPFILRILASVPVGSEGLSLLKYQMHLESHPDFEEMAATAVTASVIWYMLGMVTSFLSQHGFGTLTADVFAPKLDLGAAVVTPAQVDTPINVTPATPSLAATNNAGDIISEFVSTDSVFHTAKLYPFTPFGFALLSVVSLNLNDIPAQESTEIIAAAKAVYGPLVMGLIDRLQYINGIIGSIQALATKLRDTNPDHELPSLKHLALFTKFSAPLVLDVPSYKLPPLS